MSLGNVPTKWNQHCRIPVLYGGLIVNDFLTIYIYRHHTDNFTVWDYARITTGSSLKFVCTCTCMDGMLRC